MRPYPGYEGTRLWRGVRDAIRELEATGEVRITTGADYVIGYLCHELAARDLVSPGAVARRAAGGPGEGDEDESESGERAGGGAGP
jgi:hypothetical protein